MITPKSCTIKPGEYICITYRTADEANSAPAPDTITWSMIKNIHINRQLLIVALHTSSSPLIIPLTAFEFQDQALNLVTEDSYNE